MRFEIVRNDNGQIQVKSYLGEKFTGFAPNKKHFQLGPVRPSFLAAPNLLRRGDKAFLIVSKEQK